MSADWYSPGSYNVVCQRTGYKIKASRARKEWNGLMVDRRVWEERHPQDFVRAVQDDQSVPDPRPEASLRFLAPNDVTPENLNPIPTGSPARTIWDAGATVWDGTFTDWY